MPSDKIKQLQLSFQQSRQFYVAQSLHPNTASQYCNAAGNWLQPVRVRFDSLEQDFSFDEFPFLYLKHRLARKWQNYVTFREGIKSEFWGTVHVIIGAWSLNMTKSRVDIDYISSLKYFFNSKSPGWTFLWTYHGMIDEISCSACDKSRAKYIYIQYLLINIRCRL